MTTVSLPFQNKLSGSYSKKVSFKNSSIAGYNRYVRKLGKGFSCITIEYSLKYIGLTETELAEIETLFGSHNLDMFISWKAPIDVAAINYNKPKTWDKDSFIEATTRELRINLSFSIRSYTKSKISVFPVPTYTITPDVYSVNEGSTLTFTVATRNVPDGDFYYTLQGTLDSSDVVGGSLSGGVTIASGVGTFQVTFVEDLTTEGEEALIAELRTGSTSGTIVATSAVVTINDTSTTPPLTVCSIGEGGIIASISGGHGLAVLPYDLSSAANWTTADGLCTSCTEGGFTNWRLMTSAEASWLQSITCLGWSSEKYWTSSQGSPGFYYWRQMNVGGAGGVHGTSTPLYTRPVRDF